MSSLKYVSSSMCPTLPQLAIADFIKSGGYERHLRKIRLEYKQGRDLLIAALNKYFPSQTCISFPEGGYLLWVELPKEIDVVKLAKKVIKRALILLLDPSFLLRENIVIVCDLILVIKMRICI